MDKCRDEFAGMSLLINWSKPSIDRHSGASAIFEKFSFSPPGSPKYFTTFNQLKPTFE
jgi:hypothetical protein